MQRDHCGIGNDMRKIQVGVDVGERGRVAWSEVVPVSMRECWRKRFDQSIKLLEVARQSTITRR